MPFDYSNEYAAPPRFMNQGTPQPNANRQQVRDMLRLAEELAPYGEEERDISRQQKMVDELRGTTAPEGRSYAGVYKAANPLEFLGAGANRYVGQEMQKELDKRRLENVGGGEKRPGGYIGALRRVGADFETPTEAPSLMTPQPMSALPWWANMGGGG